MLLDVYNIPEDVKDLSEEFRAAHVEAAVELVSKEAREFRGDNHTRQLIGSDLCPFISPHVTSSQSMVDYKDDVVETCLEGQEPDVITLTSLNGKGGDSGAFDHVMFRVEHRRQYHQLSCNFSDPCVPSSHPILS